MSIPATQTVSVPTDRFDAVIFDLDGVITRTAKVHSAAWKKLFDQYLRERSRDRDESFIPFDIETDYSRYVDGKPRYQGVQSFLESRNIHLPWGDPGDPPAKETVCGLGNRKNRIFRGQLQSTPPEVYPASIELVRDLNRVGMRIAVVTSSKNCDIVLETAAIDDLFPIRVDGNDLEQFNLKGKPEPDQFIEAASRLHVKPERSVVVEDAEAGVEAGRKGDFGLVIGIDRTGHGEQLKSHGADVVIPSLSEIVITEETT